MTVGAYRVTSSWDEGTGAWGDCTGDGASWAERTGSVAWDSPGGDYVSTPVATKAHTANEATRLGQLRHPLGRPDMGGRRCPEPGHPAAHDKRERRRRQVAQLPLRRLRRQPRAAPEACHHLRRRLEGNRADRGDHRAHGRGHAARHRLGRDRRRATTGACDSVEFLVDGVSKAHGHDRAVRLQLGHHRREQRRTHADGACHRRRRQSSPPRPRARCRSATPRAHDARDLPSGAYQRRGQGRRPGAYWRLGETTGTDGRRRVRQRAHRDLRRRGDAQPAEPADRQRDPAVQLASGGTVTRDVAGAILPAR